MFKTRSGQWIVCQIGAREHYAIARALHQAGKLAALVTDLWCPPGSLLSRLFPSARIRDRWHPDLATAPVFAPNFKMLAFEGWARARQLRGWSLVLARNQFFQTQAIRRMPSLTAGNLNVSHLFSYSYAANELFEFGRNAGWANIMGQIDPGPEEQRIVADELLRYPMLGSRWQPAPMNYWSNWRTEIGLADCVVVNSEWSQKCLLKEGISAEKMVTIPLVYERSKASSTESHASGQNYLPDQLLDGAGRRKLKILFLGQINLRKGIGRLLDAMRILQHEPIELTLAGPSEIDPQAWADLPNVHWMGPVPRSAVGRAYQAADLFILPTLSDGYAITQLEALAYDLPVMRSTCCGDPFAAGNTDLTLDSLEPASISAALLRFARTGPPNNAQATPIKFTMSDLARCLVNAFERESSKHSA